jgi:uncharacterized protein
MRVILDTNILCSALLTPAGVTDRVYRAWREKRFVLITSDEQLEEFRRVTRYPRVRAFIEPAAAGSMFNEIRRLAERPSKLPSIDRSKDPADNFLLALAQAGHADYLVTGDKDHLLSLGTFGPTRIITARELLRRLGARPRRRAAPNRKARKRGSGR